MGRASRRLPALAWLVFFAVVSPAGAALNGPNYPLPAWHGGNQCVPLSADPLASGTTGQTWTFGGGGATPTASMTCDGVGLPPPFDTSKFQAAYWGMNANDPPKASLDNDAYDDPAETMTFNPGLSNLAAGTLVWNGHTHMNCSVPTSCGGTANPVVETSLLLTITSLNTAPVDLTTPLQAGIASDQVGGVAAVTALLTNFKATFLFRARFPGVDADPWFPLLSFYNSIAGGHPAPPEGHAETATSFSGAFYWANRPPTADFSCTPASPVAGQTITCTANDPDPDGAPGDVLQEDWDWDGDGITNGANDKTGHVVSGTFSAGLHNVTLFVTDRDGGTASVKRSIVVGEAPVSGGTSGGGGTTSTTSGSGTTGGSPAGGSPAAADTTAPAAVLVVAKAKLAALLKKGIAGTITSNEAGSAQFSVTLPKKLAKKLRLAGVIGSGRSTLTAGGKTAFVVKIGKKAAAKLRKLKSVTFVLVAQVSDGAGNKASVTKSVKAKR